MRTFFRLYYVNIGARFVREIFVFSWLKNSVFFLFVVVLHDSSYADVSNHHGDVEENAKPSDGDSEGDLIAIESYLAENKFLMLFAVGSFDTSGIRGIPVSAGTDMTLALEKVYSEDAGLLIRGVVAYRYGFMINHGSMGDPPVVEPKVVGRQTIFPFR